MFHSMKYLKRVKNKVWICNTGFAGVQSQMIHLGYEIHSFVDFPDYMVYDEETKIVDFYTIEPHTGNNVLLRQHPVTFKHLEFKTIDLPEVNIEIIMYRG
jgi:hypothetical protein